MFRARLPFALLLALPLVACAKADPPTPSPEPAATTKVEAKPVDAPKAPEAVNEAPQNAQGAPGVQIPAAKDGVLPAGAADKILKIGDKPVVKLLEPGAEPRADLSYALTKGAKDKLEMTMDMTMAMKLGARAMPTTAIPAIKLVMAMGTAEQNAAGEWKIDAKLTETSVGAGGGANQDQIAAAMRPQIEAMKGLGLSYWVNAKGNVHDLKLDVPKHFPPSAQQVLQGMNQSFESLVAPLPAEPVGAGAKWQVVSRVVSGGADLLQSATYKLVSRNANKVALEVTTVQYSATDTIKPPGMPANAVAKVKAFNSSGNGTTALDTKSVAPDSGNMQVKTAMTLAVQNEETSVETTTLVRTGRK